MIFYKKKFKKRKNNTINIWVAFNSFGVKYSKIFPKKDN